MSTQTLAAYRAANEGIGFLDRSDRVRIAVGGPDRAKLLHNLTTNDVKRLAPGRGCEAFVTSPQGKTLGYVSLLAEEERILLRTEPESLTSVLPHLEKYGLFDDATIDDVTAQTFELHLAGPRVEELLGSAGIALTGEGELVHVASLVAGRPVRLVRESPTGRPGWTLLGLRADAAEVLRTLRQAGEPLGWADLDDAAFEALRIEAGTPASGRDVTPENLPQEVRRDARAINFVKGCYLGQETVARIDALGHVNKFLCGLRLEGPECPPPRAPIEWEGKPLGTVTSAADSPGCGGPIALGYVKASHAKAGTPVLVAAGEARLRATVTDLPMVPRSEA